MTDVVAVFEITPEDLAEHAGNPNLDGVAAGHYWQRLRDQGDGDYRVDLQAGPFPVHSEAFQDACLERTNQGLPVEDWRARPDVDLSPVESTVRVDREAFTVEGGPDAGVVPLHDTDGTVLPGHEGSPETAPEGWPFDAQVTEGIPAAADGTPAVLEGDPSGEPGIQVRQLPVGVAVDQDGNAVWTEDAPDDYEPGSLIEDADGAPLPPVDDPRFDEVLDAVLVEAGMLLPPEDSHALDEEVDDQEAEAAAEAERALLEADAAASAEALERHEHGGEA